MLAALNIVAIGLGLGAGSLAATILALTLGGLLTVAGVDERHFDVQIIPHTWTHTNLQAARSGEPVNLECDMIGKYVIRSMELRKQ